MTDLRAPPQHPLCAERCAKGTRVRRWAQHSLPSWSLCVKVNTFLHDSSQTSLCQASTQQLVGECRGPDCLQAEPETRLGKYDFLRSGALRGKEGEGNSGAG